MRTARTKLSALVLAAAVSVGLVGCTQGTPEEGPSKDAVIPEGDLADQSGTLTPSNPTTLTTWITTASQAPAADNKITKLLEEQARCHPEVRDRHAGQRGPEDRCHARGRRVPRPRRHHRPEDASPGGRRSPAPGRHAGHRGLPEPRHARRGRHQEDELRGRRGGPGPVHLPELQPLLRRGHGRHLLRSRVLDPEACARGRRLAGPQQHDARPLLRAHRGLQGEEPRDRGRPDRRLRGPGVDRP